MRVCIDAGHGGFDPGASMSVNINDQSEKHITLAIALLLEKELLATGYKTYMTRRIDRTLSLNARADFANQYNVDLFVSIHCNSAQSTAADGIETWIHPFSSARNFAQAVQNELINKFPSHDDRGVKEANFYVLRETQMPAILVETEFINNPAQAQFLTDPNNQQAIAEAIKDGIFSISPPT